MKLIDIIKEQSLGYTPDGIDSFVQEASAFYNKVFDFYRKNYDMILMLTIQECINDFGSLKERFKKLEEVKTLTENKFGKYLDIVDTFEIGEYPENVKKLEEISNNLDNLSMNLGEVADGLDHLLDSAKYLSKHNQ